MPLLLTEIEYEVEYMVERAYATGNDVRQFMNRLYVQTGDAEATYALGGHRVWAPPADPSLPAIGA